MTAVFDWCKAHGHFTGENPASGIKRGLPMVKASDAHHAALPWADLPAFATDLQAREGVSARCLSFIILTACRSNEARGARWAEIDLQDQTWTIPGERTKTGKPHTVPLCAEALQVLREVEGLDRDLVFPTAKRGPGGKGAPMSDMVFKALFVRMGREGITAHGFRSTFRDWASEHAHADRMVAEAALAHVLPPVERAYARSDLLARRRLLMDQWGAFTALPRQVGPDMLRPGDVLKDRAEAAPGEVPHVRRT
jgi:integrase